jgi:putative ATPase
MSVDVVFDEKAQQEVVAYADGDARRLLQFVEQILLAAKQLRVNSVTTDLVRQLFIQQHRRFDKQGELFYDQISALHKSVRGSNPDAALYWLCRMIDGGVSPTYLARRIVRMAWEDIGLADPRAIQLANNAAQTYERLGSPEGELALAEAVLYLAVAAKSNAAYAAFKQAMAFVKRDKTREVPLHLRQAPTDLMKKLGYGDGYRYAHDEAHGFAAGETYFPEGMKAPHWYQPVDRGLEKKVAEKMAFLRQLDEQHATNN